MPQQFAQATIDATVWLICYRPDRLRAWLDSHQPDGPLLEQVARSQIRNIDALGALSGCCISADADTGGRRG